MRSVSIADAAVLIETYVKAGLVPMLKSKPGIGKSSIVKQFADTYNLSLIDVRLAQCDPTDLLGFPDINKEKNKASYVPMDTFPLENDVIPEGYNGWCVFMDEFNAADRGVQKASYKIILDKMIGANKIHSKVVMITAGNNDTDGALVEELSSALQSRLAHIHVVSYPPGWIKWATKAGIANEVISFIDWLPQSLNMFSPEKQGEEPTYPCERTWEMVSKVISNDFDPQAPLALEKLAGIIGEGKALEFINFLKIYKDLLTIPDILAAPSTVPMPCEAGTLYALTGVIGQAATKSNATGLIEFVSRMPKEYQVICLRCIVAKDPSLMRERALVNWTARNNIELFA